MSPMDEEKALAVAYGAKCTPDPRRGYQWCKYELLGWHIWKCVMTRRVMWQCARLVDGHYTDHTPQKTLKEALEWTATYTGK